MARAHFVKKARTDNPVCKAGESYWWWKFKHGAKQYSKTRPKPSQLTQSTYKATVLDLIEQAGSLDRGDPENWSSGIADALEELAGEQADNLAKHARGSATRADWRTTSRAL